MKTYEVESYKTEAGDKPFQSWFDNLKDSKARTIILSRLERASHGLLGDWKPIGGSNGLFEMRIHFGPGYRLLYAIVGQKLILLLAGATKQDQDRAIAKAREYLADYQQRAKS